MKKENMSREKSLFSIIKYRAGRDARGRISVRHKGGRHKRYFRDIDFKRDKRDIVGKVVNIEYDPNIGADIALIYYRDGDKRYILAPDGLKLGNEISSGEKAEVKTGNAMPLSKIPIGIPIHNLEMFPKTGGMIVRGAGNSASVLAKEDKYTRVRLPSSEIRLFDNRCYATIGQLSNPERKNRLFKKAGNKRHLGIKPTVRGVAQDPDSHPHGGGEGRSGIGMPSPKSPWGKPTLGKRTRKANKASNKFIVKRRK